MNNRDFFRKIAILFCLLVLCASGIISVSAGTESFGMALKQLMRLVYGAAVMAAVSAIPFKKLEKIFPYGIAFSLLLLIILLFAGTRINGMRGWFRFGSWSFQPSEPGKAFFLAGLALIMTSSHICGKFKKELFSLLYLAGWLTLLLLQPDMGTAMIYGVSFLCIWFLCGVDIKLIGSLILSGAICASLFVLHHPYAMRRIYGFLNPEDDPLGRGWHLRQLLRTISRGSWTGVKLDHAIWSRKYLPYAGNDSIFAVISEITGFCGAVVVPLALAAISFILFRTAAEEELDMRRRVYISGAAFMLLFQGLFHISVNIGLLPVTGITLPFVSFGGCSVISGALLIGISFSAMRSDQTKE